MGRDGFIKNIVKQLSRWRRDTSAATAIEYGMMIVGLSVFIMGIIFTMGDSIRTIFENINEYLVSRL